MKIEINRQDVAEVKRMLESVSSNARPAISRAQNKALTGTRTDMTKIVTNYLNVKAKDVRDPIKLNKSSAANLAAWVRRTGKPLGLAKFTGTRQLLAGVSVKVKKTGARATLKHAFMAETKSGHVGVFWRKRKPTGKPKKGFAYGRLPKMYRLPIEELTGPRIEDILSQPDNMKQLEHQAGDRLVKELSHEVDRMFTGEVG